MELRVLQYFLAVAREQSIIRAAESLHLSQPTLSTQIKNMEKELGKQLLIRGSNGSRKVTLTEEGMILRKRAEEILDLVKKRKMKLFYQIRYLLVIFISELVKQREYVCLPGLLESFARSILAFTIIFPAAIPNM